MRARKRFGQHFLEPVWADKVVEAVNPAPGDRFLEIGPGPGALTRRLAPRVAHLTAIEIDRDLVAALARELPPHVEVIAGDILAVDLAPLLAGEPPLRVAGNLPYNISTPILFRLMHAGRTPPGWRDATLMLQREVADRLQALPGSRDYGVLSVSVQRHATVTRVLDLPPGAFRPMPRVHSAVVRLVPAPGAVPVQDDELFDAVVRAIFGQRRKTIGNSLAPFAAARDIDARRALAAAGIDPGRRAETLRMAEIAALAAALVPR